METRNTEEAPPAPLTVECPCCHGKETLEIVDSNQPGGILVVGCNHCIGGRVPSEVA